MQNAMNIDLAAVFFSALVSGWLAGLVTRGDGFGFAGNCLAALVGAFVAYYFAGLFGIRDTAGFAGVVLIGFLGAFSMLAMIGHLRRG